MIWEMQSTNQMWSRGISRTSSALMIEVDGTVEVTAIASRPHRRDAPALQEGDEEDTNRGEVEDVLRAGVHRAPHLHDLEGPEEVPAALEVPRDDDAVRDRLLHAEVGVPLLRGADLGDKEGRAPAGAEHRAELQDEVPDVLLGL